MRSLSEVAVFTAHVKQVSDLLQAITGVSPKHTSDDAALFELEGVTFLVHRTGASSNEGPANVDHFAFATEDLDATYADLVARGVEFDLAPKSYAWGRSAYLSDPDGRMIEIQEKPAD